MMKLIYVRFGEIPANGKSKNYLTGEYEKGVSVYEALEREGKDNERKHLPKERV